MAIRLTPRQLVRVLKGQAKGIPTRIINKGIKQAASESKDILQFFGPVFEKNLKKGWQNPKKLLSGKGYVVQNIAPHAGVVESGARPHLVSIEGQESIRRWVSKKLLGIPSSLAEQNEEVNRITAGIVHSIATKGQKGQFFVKKEIPRFTAMAAKEAFKSIHEFVSKASEK